MQKRVTSECNQALTFGGILVSFSSWLFGDDPGLRTLETLVMSTNDRSIDQNVRPVKGNTSGDDAMSDTTVVRQKAAAGALQAQRAPCDRGSVANLVILKECGYS